VQLWKSPELQFPIANANLSQLYMGTPKGDVYSFAIIVQEILYRRGVFHLNEEDMRAVFKFENDNSLEQNIASVRYRDIYQRVKSGLRPSLDSSKCSKEVIDLLKRCWSESPNERPEFSIINELMRKTTKYVHFKNKI
jgi:atrial natriuretic peptide receptor A